ncbi:MAG: bifunctional serine/threonine-protein kinase/formylglycine-generating enzyme family protein [Candidatus Sumerlaeota bacterium]|nr:bifunctional serine/threonine-protein kinase/formylglycine-generating enzyme family protein [Candidatus Sumerlaeota bacterium]
MEDRKPTDEPPSESPSPRYSDETIKMEKDGKDAGKEAVSPGAGAPDKAAADAPRLSAGASPAAHPGHPAPAPLPHPPASETEEPSEQLDGGRLTLLEKLGEGGMGVVYKARDNQVGRYIAIKRPKGPMLATAKGRARFIREAQSAARLAHPNIVTVYRVSEDEEGPYLEMEYMEGRSLRDEIKYARHDWSVARVCEAGVHLCDALDAAHAQGIIHRDIKPSNILLTARGIPKIGDFGLSAALYAESGAISSSMTQTGAAMGSMFYSSPEQLADAKSADARSDIYALAATLYYAITGEDPRIIHLSLLPEAIRDVFQKALESDPARRFANMKQFAEALKIESEVETAEAHERQRAGLLQFIRQEMKSGAYDKALILLRDAPYEGDSGFESLRRECEDLQKRALARSKKRWQLIGFAVVSLALVLAAIAIIYFLQSGDGKGASSSGHGTTSPTLSQGAGATAGHGATSPTLTPGAGAAAGPKITPPALAQGAGVAPDAGAGTTSTARTTEALSAAGGATSAAASGNAPPPSYNEELGLKARLKMVWIEGGRFEMGSPETERGHQLEETRRPVTLGGFWLSATEITQAQYEAVMKTNPSYFKDTDPLSLDLGPVEQVSWEDAMKFCQELTIKTGKAYQLPTEAQWEYACRAGTKTPFYTGENIMTSQANYNGDFTYVTTDTGVFRRRTSPVKAFAPNPWGLYDLHGNVSEWCLDWYDEKYYSTPQAASNPKGPATGTLKVFRGGAWDSLPVLCRSASRNHARPGVRSSNIGFRVARIEQ